MTRDSNGPIEALGFRLLLKINEHTAKSRKGSNTARAAWSKVLAERQREKGANMFLAKQYQLHISNARKGIVLDQKTILPCTSRQREIGF